MDATSSVSQTDADTAKKSTPAEINGEQFSGEIPPIATQGISNTLVHHSIRDISGRWLVSLVFEAKKAPKAT